MLVLLFLPEKALHVKMAHANSEGLEGLVSVSSQNPHKVGFSWPSPGNAPLKVTATPLGRLACLWAWSVLEVGKIGVREV